MVRWINETSRKYSEKLYKKRNFLVVFFNAPLHMAKTMILIQNIGSQGSQHREFS